MGYSEYILWTKYRQKYGPLNPVRMYDRGSAIVATTVNNAHGGKAKFEDFIIRYEEDEEFNPDLDITKLMLGGVKVSKDRKVKIGRFKRG